MLQQAGNDHLDAQTSVGLFLMGFRSSFRSTLFHTILAKDNVLLKILFLLVVDGQLCCDPSTGHCRGVDLQASVLFCYSSSLSVM